ncbi:MAG: DUF2914 domain-containing protein [Gammaproteobacteria bacterium]
MVEHKKALKIKITMQSPKTPAKASEAQKRGPRLVLPASVGLALGLGSVLVWWGFTAARTDGRGKEVAPLDAQLMLERPVTSPRSTAATLDTVDPSVASPIDEAVSERIPDGESTQAQPETEPLGRIALPQTAPTPIQAVPMAEEIVASAERARAATEPQQMTDNPVDVPVPGPQAPSEKLAAVAPPPSSKESAKTPLTSDSAHIARALFTSAIKGGLPTDREGPVIFSRGRNGKSLYFFTELRGLKGKTVTHRWEYQGNTMFTIPFKIGSNRWRVYSNKNLPTKMTGTWRVVVADPTGAVLAAKEFHYQKR